MKHENNLHEQILLDINAEIDLFPSAASLAPAVVATAVLRRMHMQPLEPKVEYSCLEHLKQMARGALAGRYSTEQGEESTAYQHDMFTGHLQTRYPIPPKKGVDPVYKPLVALTLDEVAWNVAQLRKSGQARLQHARALEAWSESRQLPPEAA